MLPLRARVDQGAMVMKGYSAFPKAPALLEPHHQHCWNLTLRTLVGGGVLPLCRETVGVFYNPSRLGNVRRMFIRVGIRKTRNTYDSLFWFRYETFYYLFEFKVFRHEERERETHADFSIWLHHVRHPAANYWSCLGELRKSTNFL